MPKLLATAALAALLCACGQSGSAQTSATAMRPGAPVPTDPPNAKGQAPAFPGQTRAPEIKSGVAFGSQTYVSGIDKPWGLAFLPGGGLLITEKAGRLRLFKAGKLSDPIGGLPPIDARDQGGLLGVAVDPNYAANGRIYLSFSEGYPDGKTNTAVASGQLVLKDGQAPILTDTKVIWRQTPPWESTKHFGSRLVFDNTGALFITTGERSVASGRMQAQNLGVTLGKIVRIKTDGSIPADNPFVGREGVKPEIWSNGHRNIQAAAINPRSGVLWEVEHGTRGGDEVNIVKKGADYGWPSVAYGVEYAGGKITGGLTQKAGTEQPAYYWDPVIAPSGMAFYEADLFPAWKGSLFVGGLRSTALVRLVLDGDKIVGEERLLTDLGQRIRDVIVGPDGALYVATDETAGKVLRIAPKP
ncbi:PQQ-dependent sugar dehydrogenase [Phenylobacterium immobile]|uniref:PQQ-dependent sugar dehydrogenase n=1 Tax=Phenylobacterium immobile TaxID=21 RepID=UPI000A64FC98|nr:PQQ-dependent sugar dehydrogenase [Phenylobacterium immobile]